MKLYEFGCRWIARGHSYSFSAVNPRPRVIRAGARDIARYGTISGNGVISSRPKAQSGRTFSEGPLRRSLRSVLFLQANNGLIHSSPTAFQLIIAPYAAISDANRSEALDSNCL